MQVGGSRRACGHFSESIKSWGTIKRWRISCETHFWESLDLETQLSCKQTPPHFLAQLLEKTRMLTGKIPMTIQIEYNKWLQTRVNNTQTKKQLREACCPLLYTASTPNANTFSARAGPTSIAYTWPANLYSHPANRPSGLAPHTLTSASLLPASHPSNQSVSTLIKYILVRFF